MGRLAEIIEGQLDFKLRAEFPPYAEALAAATAEQILKANPDRVSWDIFNLGTDVVYLSHDPVPSATNGYWLDKNGGHIGMSWETDGELVAYPVYAISVGTPTLFIKGVVGK